MSFKFNPFTVNFDETGAAGTTSYWADPVADLTALNLITTDTDGTVRLVLATNDAYRWNGGTVAWEYINKVKSSTFGSSPNTAGFSIGSDNTLTLQPADATHGGGVSTGTQTFAGNKTFSGTISASNFSGSSSGTNTGDVTLSAFGSSPNSNGASLSSQALTLQPADSTNPGGVSTGTQTMAGAKTFSTSLSSAFFSSTTANSASAGILRLANTQTINWRNFANSGNLGLSLDASDVFQLDSALNITGNITASNFSGSSSGTNTGDVTLTNIGFSGNAQGASLSGQALTLQAADATHPGVVSVGTQSFGGTKTFDILIANNYKDSSSNPAASGSISLGNASPIAWRNSSNTADFTLVVDGTNRFQFNSGITTTGTIVASNFSGSSTGTNTGDVTLAAVGSSPNANAATLTGQVLNLQPADATNPGVVTTGVQTFAGNKTFTGTIAASNLSGTNTGDVTLSAFGSSPNANGASISGQALTLQPADATNPGGMSTGTQTVAGDKTFSSSVTTPAETINGAANSQRLVIGDNNENPIGGTWASIAISDDGTNSAAALRAMRHSTSQNSKLDWGRSRGTFSAQTTLANGDDIFALRVLGYDGSSYNLMATILSSVDGVVSAGVVPGRFVFSVSPNAGGVPVEALRISQDKTSKFSGTVNLNTLSASTALTLDASKNIQSTTYTSANTANAIVQRDGSGNFSAGTITASLTGTASGNTTISGQTNHGVVVASATNAMTSTTAGTAGQVLTSNGASADPTFQAISTVGPTVQKFTSGSGTYTKPTSPSPLYIKVRMIGGGGGGRGTGTSGASDGGTGGNTTFGSSLLVANGGTGGVSSSGGTGGSTSITGPTGISIDGGSGDSPVDGNVGGGKGGGGASSAFGGRGGSNAGSGTGNSATTNSGSGGGGASGGGGFSAGGGGGSGGWVDVIITSPSATYSYAVGAAGSAGSAGTSGYAGGAGGAGLIVVEEFYQ